MKNTCKIFKPGQVIYLLTVIIISFSAFPLYGEHVFLKNGSVISGRLVSVTDAYGDTVKEI